MDQREDHIENLEYELEEQRRRTRKLFKQGIKAGQPSSSAFEENDEEEDEGQMAELKDLIEEMQEELDYGK